MDFLDRSISKIKSILDSSSLEERKSIIPLLLKDNRAGVLNLAKSYNAKIAKYEAEEALQAQLTRIEHKLYKQGFEMIAGVDEAGRGALAGPIVAAAVILPKNVKIYGLRDSKQLTPQKREILYNQIIEKAIAWSISQIEHNEIDANGIQWANYNVLEKAVASLQPSADYVLSDGFSIKSLSVPHLAITKGDALSLSIAAASVLAKVTRDRIMDEYDSQYPQYGFARHKGYGTLLHKRALEKYGLSPIHRNYFVASFL